MSKKKLDHTIQSNVTSCIHLQSVNKKIRVTTSLLKWEVVALEKKDFRAKPKDIT